MRPIVLAGTGITIVMTTTWFLNPGKAQQGWDPVASPWWTGGIANVGKALTVWQALCKVLSMLFSYLILTETL